MELAQAIKIVEDRLTGDTQYSVAIRKVLDAAKKQLDEENRTAFYKLICEKEGDASPCP